MKEQFVTYEIALKLKELGFDEPCLGAYSEDKNWKFIYIDENNGYLFMNSSMSDAVSGFLSAPLWQQVIDWFKIKYNWLIVIDVANSNEYYASVREFDETGAIISKIPYKIYSIYEEAREKAILKAIEICKNIK